MSRYLRQFHCRRGKAFPHYFYTFLYQYVSSVSDTYDPTSDARPEQNIFNMPSPLANASELADADEKIGRIYRDFDKIAFFLNEQDGNTNDQDTTRARPGERRRTLSGAFRNASWLLTSAISSHLLLPCFRSS